MKSTEILLVIALVTLIVWVALREQSSIVVILVPFEKRAEPERVAMTVPEMPAVPKFHGFATA